MNLISKKCVPCEGGTPPFTAEQIATYMPQVPGWELVDGKKIVKTFKLADFLGALAFVNAVGKVAEADGHHPDIAINYSRVTLTLWTHAIGGLSENDFIVAVKIDAIKLDDKYISIDDFAKMNIKMGKIITAERIEGADKLLKLTVDLGEGTPRTICSGIAQYYQPEELPGKMVPVLANLAPRKMRGLESNGMILFGIDESTGGHVPVILNPGKEVPPGSPVQ